MHRMHRMHPMYRIWLQWHEWRGCLTGRFANCLSWQREFPWNYSLLDLIPQCTSPRDLRWKCHRLRCSQRHVGSPGTVVIGPTGVVSEQALITIFISIISPPRVIHFWPYLFFNRMQASMDHLWLFHGILQISTLHVLIICCLCLLSLIQARNHDGTWLSGRSQCSWRAAVRAHDAVRAAFCWSLMWVATGKTWKNLEKY